MKKFRENVAIAIDGGGIRGVIVTKALTLVEQQLGKPLYEFARLTVGTSTGSIIAAGLACGLSAETLNRLYLEMGDKIFRKSLRTVLWIFFNHRYSRDLLEKSMQKYLGNRLVGDLWKAKPSTDLVITTFDILENRTRFIKPWKDKYAEWPLVKAVLASSAAPTYFPSMDGQFVDGGVGSYNNPCYLAAYEIQFCLGWKAEETTLISIGTGRDPNLIKRGAADHLLPVQYVNPLLDAFAHSADDQQVHLVDTFFKGLDFRRFQVDLKTQIPLDDTDQIQALNSYGEELGRMILEDRMDGAQNVQPELLPRKRATARKSTSRPQTNKSGTPAASPLRKSPKSAPARRKR